MFSDSFVMHHEIVANMTLEELETCAAMFKHSKQPMAQTAYRLVATEIRLRRKRIRDNLREITEIKKPSSVSPRSPAPET